MKRSADVVIIGGGVMGASILYHLARAGCTNTILLEKEPLLGSGATGQCAGGIRHQFSTEINISLSKLSIQMLHRFKDEIGQEVDLRLCGYLFLLDNERDLETFRGNVVLQNELGVPSRVLDPIEIGALVPDISQHGIVGGAFCPEDGLADPSSVVQGFAGRATKMGSQIQLETPATGIRIGSDKVRSVQTTRGVIETGTVVIATGPWSGKVGCLAGVDLPVQPVRRQLAITRPIAHLKPDFPFVIDFSTSLYFHLEGGGILTGMSNPAQPPGFSIDIDEDWRWHHFEKAMERMPLLQEAEIQTEWAGLYEVTPDNQPILGHLPHAEGLIACTGFSGHGFMHGPVCGLLMAEEILEGQATTIDISPLRWDRFDQAKRDGEFNVV
jgi:sarcosine oxidase subunit beta